MYYLSQKSFQLPLQWFSEGGNRRLSIQRSRILHEILYKSRRTLTEQGDDDRTEQGDDDRTDQGDEDRTEQGDDDLSLIHI